jgi:hypothetical protein
MVDKAGSEEFSQDKNRGVSADEDKQVKIVLSKVLNETYLAISEESQCVYFRNYMKRIVFNYLLRHSKGFHCPAFPVRFC